MNEQTMITIRDVLVSPNAIAILVFLGVCLIGGLVLIKSGMLQVHTKAVTVSAADTERNIIRQQMNYVLLHLTALENNLKKPEGYNEYLGKYIIEKVYDEYMDWITFNHLSKSPAYIEVKQLRIIDLIGQYTVKEEFKTDEFIEMMKKDTKQTILALIQIREIYKD